MSVLVDSDILIEVSRGRDADLVSRWTELSRSDVAILYSPVTAAELWAGARPPPGSSGLPPGFRSAALSAAYSSHDRRLFPLSPCDPGRRPGRAEGRRCSAGARRGTED